MTQSGDERARTRRGESRLERGWMSMRGRWNRGGVRRVDDERAGTRRVASSRDYISETTRDPCLKQLCNKLTKIIQNHYLQPAAYTPL